MVVVKECPDCKCVMEPTAWHTEDDVGAKQGTGDFDCRNCGRIFNNEKGDLNLEAWREGLFDGVDEDITFKEFKEMHEDKVR